MLRKFILPDSPDQRKTIWKYQLDQVNDVLSEIRNKRIDINTNMINLQIRARSQEGLESDISACHKLELDNRMAELALLAQRLKLSNIIYMLEHPNE